MSVPERTSFVGRRAELERLREIATPGKLVTLLGPPGVGKTRLARRFARELGTEACVCDLGEVTDVDQLVAAMRRDLGADVAAGAPEEAIVQLGAMLEARGPMLLVLDDAERLTPPARSAIAAWTRAAPRTTLLITSRTRLGLAEEHVLDVRPLSLPEPGDPGSGDAVALFRERARAARDEAVSDADAADVAELVRRLDGLPLAIELAAARSRVLGPRQILAALTRPFELLAAPGAPTVSRHASLRAAIDASWEPLSDLEREVLATCSVFCGGFDLAAAQEVLAPGRVTALDALQSLCDRSLLTAQSSGAGGARFCLYQSVREYAAERLDPNGRRAAEARHAQHFLGKAALLADRADRSDTDALAWLSAEQDNLIAVHRRALEEQPRAPAAVERAVAAALALDPLLFAQGPTSLRTALLDAALAAAADLGLPAATLAEAHLARGRARQRLGQTEGSVGDYQRALDLAREIGDARLEGYALTCLGTQHAARGALSSARALQHAAIALLQAAGARVLEGRVFVNLGNVLRWSGAYAEARAAFERALDLQVELGDAAQEGNTLANLARLDQEEGRLDLAEMRYRRAVALYRRCGDRRFLGPTLCDLGGLLQEVGRLEEARERYDEARDVLARASDRRWLALLTGRVGTWQEDRGDRAGARPSYLEAIEGFERTGFAAAESLVLAHLGGLDGGEGREAAARDALARAEGHLLRAGSDALLEVVRVHRARIDVAAARAAAAAGEAEAARTLCADARRLLDAAEAPRPAPLDLRFARRHLRAELEAIDLPPASEPAPEQLDVCPDGRWFQPPSGARVDLRTRRPLWLLFERLVDARQHRRGESVQVHELAEAGWPAERLHPEVAARRVYVALSTLRSMGLRDILGRCDGGYRIEPSLPLRVLPAQP